jgi:hypothetical protein
MVREIVRTLKRSSDHYSRMQVMVGDVPSQRLKSPYFWEQVVNELHQK